MARTPRIVIALSLLFSSLCAYQPSENTFEGPWAINTLPDVSNSNLTQVSGPALLQNLLNQEKPLVILLDAPQRTGHDAQRLVCERIGNLWKELVHFAAIDVVANRQLAAKLLGLIGLKKAQLPLILLFRKGKLQLPMIAGHIDEMSLVARLESTFFG